MTSASLATAATSTEANLYSHLGGGDRYIHETRDAAFVSLLRRHGITSLGDVRILEVGCGEGSLIRTLLHHGADADRIEGVDVSPQRARTAKSTLAEAHIAAADAAQLPYRDGSFDLVLAFTSFSAMRTDDIRTKAALEVLRVLRPGGLAVVYDFTVNPTNRATRPLREREVRHLFAEAHVDVERVTLAPPIARLFRGAPALCKPWERLPWLRTHLLAAIVKEKA